MMQVSEGAPENVDETIHLRPCADQPIDALRDIHEAIFPIRFEDNFFKQLSSGRFHTVGAFRGDDRLVGIVVWEVTSCWQADRLDGPLFSRCIGCGDSPSASCVYIMTLGCRAGFRRRGLGRALLEACVRSARALHNCVCLYLHVLAGNARAMRMYRNAHFLQLSTIRNYYPASTFMAPAAVDGVDAAAHVFARYLRNGMPPASLALLGSWRMACTLLANALSGSAAAVDVFDDERPPHGDDCHRGAPEVTLRIPARTASARNDREAESQRAGAKSHGHNPGFTTDAIRMQIPVPPVQHLV